MSNNPEFERFREISWRRALTDAEKAELEVWLKANPDFRLEWQAEMALSSSLSRLPEPAIPSNFTARVLLAIDRESVARTQSVGLGLWWEHLAGKMRWALGASFAVAIIIGIAAHNYQIQRKHELALASTMQVFSKLPNTEVLNNFDTIRAISQAPSPDDQLLALLE